MTPIETAAPATDPQMRIGHVHLRVADLERAIAFYSGVLGLDVMQKFGDAAAFLSAGGYHHHIGLNTWESKGGTPPPPGHTGLYHTAFLYPTRAALGAAVKRVVDEGFRLTGRADHGVSLAVYLDDPDGNGVELYWDKPREDWPVDGGGNLAMINAPFDVDALIAEADGVPAGRERL